MKKEAEPCYTISETQPTDLYLQAVGIICNALENNEEQIQKCVAMAFEYEIENQKLIEQLIQLEEKFVSQDDPKEGKSPISLNIYRKKRNRVQSKNRNEIEPNQTL